MENVAIETPKSVEMTDVSDTNVQPHSGVNNDAQNDVRRIKIDGEYVDVPISKLEEAYGLEKASRKRFEEAATLRKQVDEFVDTLHKGELDSLLGLIPEDKLYDFAEKMLRQKIEWEETPEDKKARILAERERDKYKKDLEDFTKKDQEQIKQQLSIQAVQELDGEIADVINQLEKTHGKMVKSPEFVQDIARIMLAQMEKGPSYVSTQKAADLAYKSWKNRIGSYVGNISRDDLKNYLTKDQLAAIRQADLDNALSQFPNSSNKRGEERVTSSKKPSLKTTKDYFEKLDKLYGR